MDQRVADAAAVLAVRGTRLACLCANADCPAAGVDVAAAAVIIHVLADTAPVPELDRALHTPIPTPEPEPPAQPTPAPPQPQSPAPEPAPATTPEPAAQPAAPPSSPPAPVRQSVGYLLSGQVIPPNMLADLLARGAKVKDLAHPDTITTVDSYRPTAAMARLVRMRYMTCSFPGCDHPATSCDVDHSVPWPTGPTHPGNLNPKCRAHHLIKTFRGGPSGWRDRQEADGTIVWTAPTGHVYRTTPGSRILFPDIPFDIPPPPTTPQKPTPATTSRNMMVPTRRRTRVQDRAARIEYERQLNQQEIDHDNALAEQFTRARQAREKPTAPTEKPDDNGPAPPF